jgi:hypothetical protein
MPLDVVPLGEPAGPSWPKLQVRASMMQPNSVGTNGSTTARPPYLRARLVHVNSHRRANCAACFPPLTSQAAPVPLSSVHAVQAISPLPSGAAAASEHPMQRPTLGSMSELGAASIEAAAVRVFLHADTV